MFLYLLTRHHTIIHLKRYIVYLLAEFVIQLIRGVSIPPAHSLDVISLLCEIGGEVLLHALDEGLQLLLLLSEVLLVLRDGGSQFARARVSGVGHLPHLLVLRDRRVHYHLNCLHQTDWDVVPGVWVQTLQGVGHLVRVSRFTVVCHRTSYQILSRRRRLS
jgi:hypothetical protein